MLISFQAQTPPKEPLHKERGQHLMTQDDFENGGKPTFRDLFAAMTDLRTEQREALRAMEERLMHALAGVVEQFRLHTEATDKKLQEIDCRGSAALEEYINSTKLAAAKREGKQEVISSTQVFVSKNWKLIGLAFIGMMLYLGDVDLHSLIAWFPGP
jgi:predicted phage gp36 major capsid-like protein